MEGQNFQKYLEMHRFKFFCFITDADTLGRYRNEKLSFIFFKQKHHKVKMTQVCICNYRTALYNKSSYYIISLQTKIETDILKVGIRSSKMFDISASLKVINKIVFLNIS
ncbi:hypothetical protein NL108_016477 [Boleophthalmus pectinirostris]|nr:hypothetical protein NL108_016477 [Boleophthalmus pectinirostris]